VATASTLTTSPIATLVTSPASAAAANPAADASSLATSFEAYTAPTHAPASVAAAPLSTASLAAATNTTS